LSVCPSVRPSVCRSVCVSVNSQKIVVWMTLHKFLKAGKPSHKLELSGDDPDHTVKMNWVSCQPSNTTVLFSV